MYALLVMWPGKPMRIAHLISENGSTQLGKEETPTHTGEWKHPETARSQEISFHRKKNTLGKPKETWRIQTAWWTDITHTCKTAVRAAACAFCIQRRTRSVTASHQLTHAQNVIQHLIYFAVHVPQWCVRIWRDHVFDSIMWIDWFTVIYSVIIFSISDVLLQDPLRPCLTQSFLYSYHLWRFSVIQMHSLKRFLTFNI